MEYPSPRKQSRQGRTESIRDSEQNRRTSSDGTISPKRQSLEKNNSLHSNHSNHSNHNNYNINSNNNNNNNSNTTYGTTNVVDGSGSSIGSGGGGGGSGGGSGGNTRISRADYDPIWDNHSRCKIVMSLGIGILLQFYSMMLSVYFRDEIHTSFLPKAFYYIEQPPDFTFAWLVMPIGAILFGHIADRYGSSTSLILTLLTMGTAVFIVGLIPPKKYLSYFSTVLYLVVRTMMALSYGGELTIAITYLSNITASPSKVAYRRGVLISALLVFMLGRLLATLSYYASDRYSSSQKFKDWVWRMSFLASAVFTLPGMFLRMTLPEDKIYAQLRVRGEIMEKPFLYAITNYRRELAVIIGSFSACIVTWKVTIEWYPKYINGNDEDVYADNVNIVVMLFMAFGFLTQGFLSDEHGMFAVLIRSFVLGFLIFTILPILIGFIEVDWILSMLQLALGIGVSAIYAPTVIWLSDWITDNRVRSTVFSFGYHISYLLFNTSVYWLCNWFDYAVGRYSGILIALYIGICILAARLILLYSQQYPFEQRDVEMVYMQVSTDNDDEHDLREDPYERNFMRESVVL